LNELKGKKEWKWGKEHQKAFEKPVERNYEIYNKKLLAIVEVLTKWRQYLLDTSETFKIWMDHKNLKYF